MATEQRSRLATISTKTSNRAASRKLYSTRRLLGRFGLYLLLTAGAMLLLLPLAWLISSSLKPEGLVFVVPPQWIPRPIVWRNYLQVWQAIPMGIFTRNTITITVFSVIGAAASASIVAFGFARLRFRGRDVLFLVLLSTMMIPSQVTLIPQYILFRTLHWINTFYPLVVPSYFGGGAFNIFLLRQFYMTLPLELDDAAKIDGCSTWQIYGRIILPQSKPALGIVAIFGFMGHWNEFFAPLIYLNSTEKYTLALGLNFFRSVEYSAWHLLMAASLMMAMPCIVVYFLAQRYFIQGIVFTGVKG